MQQPAADRLVQAASAELAAGRLFNAASLLDQAHAADPLHPMVLTKQAELAMLRKDHARAMALTEAALGIEPNFAPAWHHRSAALWLAGRKSEAVHAARRSVDIQPPNPDFRLRLAQFSVWTGAGADIEGILAPLLAAEHYDPVHHAAAVAMLGERAIAEGRFDDAAPYLDQALALQPKLDVTRMLRGMNQLRRGDFTRGWVDYASREGITALYPDGRPTAAKQLWQGEPLAGETMLVIDDQGFGDSIQFFRYLPLLRDRGAASITWLTFPPIVRLMRDSAPYATIVDSLPPGASFDVQCTSTALPRWFGTQLDSIPCRVPYLQAPLGAKRLTSRRRKVGLVWSGDMRHPRDHLRSIPAARLLALAKVPNLSFVSLQHRVRDEDMPALESHRTIARTIEAANDFADTAALIADLDLVIAVDTGIAHLAAALGKQVWIVLHVGADWRWLIQREDSPWYPTVRLFRVAPMEWLQPETGSTADGGWGPVLGRITQALRAFAAG